MLVALLVSEVRSRTRASLMSCSSSSKRYVTLRQSNIAMENGPFEDVFPIKHGQILLLS